VTGRGGGARRRLTMLWLAGLGAALAAPAAARDGRYFREDGALVREVSGSVPGPAPRVRVETDVGSVVVETGAAPEVRYRIRARVEEADEERARDRLDDVLLSATRRGDVLLFKGEASGAGLAPRLAAEFHLLVPADAPALEVTTGAGDVVVRGFRGSATLATRAGRIVADRIGGALRAETRGGHIEVGETRAGARLISGGGSVRVGSAAGDLVAQTSGGDVAVGRAGGQIRAETGGGDVTVEAAAGDLIAQTRGGNIAVGRVGGEVWAATGGGSIRVSGAGGGVRCETSAGPIVLKDIGGPIRALTSAGSIRAEWRPASRAFFDSDLQTWNGDITVAIPETLPLTIRAAVENSIGRRIRSEFPLRIEREAEDTGRPVEIAEGEVAGGGSVLRIRTLGGTIAILKARGGARP
jgi:DUF4097 and DUF4098 domain-containing protein YvlB